MKDKNTTTFRATPRGLAKLLGIGAESDDNGGERGSERVRKETIEFRFAGPGPMDKSKAEVVQILVGQICESVLPDRGRPLGDVLLDKDTPIERIEYIKGYGKELSRSREPHHSVGIAVYYAAIASALLYHDTKITKHSYAYLRDSFEHIEEWMPDHMVRHISKAKQLCRKRAKEQHHA